MIIPHILPEENTLSSQCINFKGFVELFLANALFGQSVVSKLMESALRFKSGKNIGTRTHGPFINKTDLTSIFIEHISFTATKIYFSPGSLFRERYLCIRWHCP